jgi:hypothetical protein
MPPWYVTALAVCVVVGVVIFGVAIATCPDLPTELFPDRESN